MKINIKRLPKWLASIFTTTDSYYQQQKLTLVALSEIKGVGYDTIKKIYFNTNTVENIWDLSKDELTQMFRDLDLKNVQILVDSIQSKREELISDADIILKQLFERRIVMILHTEDSFPRRFRRIENHPPWIFVEGNVQLLSTPEIVAIVGTRKPSQSGKELTQKLSRKLTNAGFVILSGLAEGVDAVAHHENLSSNGRTIAILGSGINHVFPASTGSLRKRIIKSGGAIVSEYFPNEFYSRQKFYWRNRLQSALSVALFPTECREKSGTAHTIKFAYEQGKPIYGIKDGTLSIDANNEVYRILKIREAQVFDLESDFTLLLDNLRTQLKKEEQVLSENQMEDKTNKQSDLQRPSNAESSDDQIEIF